MRERKENVPIITRHIIDYIGGLTVVNYSQLQNVVEFTGVDNLTIT